MGYNKIPLVLGFNDTTLIPSGLVEVVFNLSDNGDVCNTAPTSDQVLTFNGSNACWSSIVFPAGGGGGGYTPPGSPGTGDIITASGGSFSAKTTSSTFFDNGIADKGIVLNSVGVNGDILYKDSGAYAGKTTAELNIITNATTPGTGDIITAAGGSFSSKTTSSIFFDNGIADKNIVVDGDLTAYIPKNTSATLFDQGMNERALSSIGDVNYPAAAGTVLVRVGSAWKAMTMPALQNANSEGTDAPNYGAVTLFDHGTALSGLGDDDHTQYVLSAGSRAMSALTVTNSITANSLSATTIDFDPEGSLTINATNVTATNVVGTATVSSVSVSGDTVTATNLSGTHANLTNLQVTGTAPSSTVAPTLAAHLTTKTYVDTVDTAIIAGSVLKAIPVTISAKHTATGGISFTTVAPSSTVTPAAGNDLTNKTYVDSRTGGPMTVLAIGSGTADVDGVEHDMHWKVPAISDAAITFAATEGSSITFSTAGTYQLDVAARLNGGSSGYNRLQGTIMTYKYDADSGAWVKLTDHTSDCYVTRDATTGPFGSLNLNTMLELSAGDQLKFSVSANSLGSQCDMTEEGTILRIVGWS